MAESYHQRLQQHVDCELEVRARDALEAWEKDGWKETPGTDVDEAPLKYIALVLLDAIEERAVRLAIDKDQGVTVFGTTTYPLPSAPSHIIARGLEIVRDIIGLQVPAGQGTLSLGIRNDSLDLIVQKEGGRHIFNLPGVAEVSA